MCDNNGQSYLIPFPLGRKGTFYILGHFAAGLEAPPLRTFGARTQRGLRSDSLDLYADSAACTLGACRMVQSVQQGKHSPKKRYEASPGETHEQQDVQVSFGGHIGRNQARPKKNRGSAPGEQREHSDRTDPEPFAHFRYLQSPLGASGTDLKVEQRVSRTVREVLISCQNSRCPRALGACALRHLGRAQRLAFLNGLKGLAVNPDLDEFPPPPKSKMDISGYDFQARFAPLNLPSANQLPAGKKQGVARIWVVTSAVLGT